MAERSVISGDTARKGDTTMTEAATEAPAKAPCRSNDPDCWPDERDWLDGKTEIFLSVKHLEAHWDADIRDDDRNRHDKIIERAEAFQVRFRVELKGRLWKCICGHWCFDLGFTPIGDGARRFNLSDVLPEAEKKKLRLCDWKGCENRCIDIRITVPACTIPADYCGTIYEVGAKFELRCCGDCDCDDKSHGHVAVAGFERQGEYLFV
jgi:hypothetical protein